MNPLDLLLEPAGHVLYELQRLSETQPAGWDHIARKVLDTRRDVREALWDKLITDYGSEKRYTFENSLNHRLLVLTDWKLASRFTGHRLRVYVRRNHV